MLPIMAAVCLMAVLLTSKCSATTNTEPHITSTSAASDTTSTSPPTSPLSLAAQIGVPLLTVLGIAATTAVACFKHFRGKWMIRKRVKEARSRRAAQDKASSDQDKASSGQNSNSNNAQQHNSNSGSGV